MSDDFNFDSPDVEMGEFGDLEMNPMDNETGSGREPTTTENMSRSFMEGIIGSATDNQKIASQIKDVLPKSVGENWDTADQLLDVASRSKDNLVNPIRKEMVSFKRNINKVTPLVKRYLGDGIGNKFDELTKTPEERAVDNPDTLELTNTIGSIFNEESRQRIDAEDKKLVWDMMERQTEEDRFKIQITTMHDMMTAMKGVDNYNKTISYTFQQKSLEYDIKRFHLLRQLLEVSKLSAENSASSLKSIVHNTSLPELVKQQSSELFQQMFVEKWYGETLDDLTGMGRNMLNNFGKNLMSRASRTADSIVDSMRTVGDMADMVGGMTAGADDMEGMDDGAPTNNTAEVIKGASKMAGANVVSRTMNNLINSINDANKDKEWYKNLVSQSDNIAQNKNLFFKTLIGDMANAEGGIKGMLSPIFKILEEELPSTSRSMTSIGHLNSFKPTDPRQWDQQQRTTVVDIIPGWLERIHNLIADIHGRTSDIGYDDKSGGFISKDRIKQDILDRIITDDERKEAIGEVDTLIDLIAKDVGDVGDDERMLLREWLIREASTSADLDLRKMMNPDSFEGLNNSDQDVAKSITGALSQVYNDETLYRANGTSIEENAQNQQVKKVGKGFGKLSRIYSDDQEVLNDSITGGGRGLLHELGLLTAEGEINDLAIRQHKMLGINPDGTKSDNLSDIARRIRERDDGPTVEPPLFDLPSNTNLPEDISVNIPQSNAPPRIADLISEIDRGAPVVAGGASSLPYDTSGLLTADGFDKAIGDAVAKLMNIDKNTTNIFDMMRGSVSNSGTININPADSSDSLTNGDFEVKEYLSGILTTLASMHKANLSYYENVKNFDAGSHSIGAKVRSMIGGGLDKVSSLFKGGAAILGGLFTMGTAPLKAIREGFANKFSFSAADVYVGEETTPRITVRDFRNRPMFLRKDGEVLDKRLSGADDITCEVVDGEGMVIISQEEYDNGLVRYNVHGHMKKLGEAFGGIAGKGVDLLTGGVKISGLGLDLGKKLVSGMYNKAHGIIHKFKDVYIINEDGTKRLLGSIRDFKLGKLSVEVDGKLRQVKSLSDLYLGDIYKMGADGKMQVWASAEDIKLGLVDNTGKVIEKASVLVGKIKDGVRTVAGGLMKAVKLPFTVMGRMWESLKAKFEGKVLEKIVINIPKDILINASTVYLNNVGGKGKGSKGPLNRGTKDHPFADRSNGGQDKSKSQSDTDPMATINDIVSAMKRKANSIKGDLDEDGSKSNGVKGRYDKLMKSGRVSRAKEFIKETKSDADTIKSVILDALDEYDNNSENVDKDGNRISRPKHIKNTLIDMYGPKWEEKLSALKGDASDSSGSKDAKTKSIKDKVLNFKRNISPKSISEAINRNKFISGLKEKLGGNVKEGSESGLPKETVPSPKKGLLSGAKDSISARIKKYTDKGLDKDDTKKSREDLNGRRSPLRVISELMAPKKIKGDIDGDGVRENSWRDILNKRRKKAKDKSDSIAVNGNDSKKTIMNKLLAVGGILVTALGALTKGVGGLAKGFLNIGLKLGKTIAKGMWSGMGPLLKGMGGMIMGAATGAWDATKKLAAKAFTSSGAKKAARVAIKFGAKRAIAAAGTLISVAVSPVGWVLGVAMTCWTVWEVSTGIWDIVSRRRDIKMMEYLRHLQYGMVSGDDGTQHLSKISLRYFESEIMSHGAIIDGLIRINMTSEEVWEEYRGDFEDDGHIDNRENFIKWYEHRFLPVLFKWIKLTHSYDQVFQKRKKESIFVDLSPLGLHQLDDRLTPTLQAGFARESMKYNELDFDPLEAMYSPSTAVVCTVGRGECSAFADKLVSHLRPKVVGGDTNSADKNDSTSKSLADKIAAIPKDDAARKKAKDGNINPNTIPGYSSINIMDPVKGRNDIESKDVPSNYVLKSRPEGGKTLDKIPLDSDVGNVVDYIKRAEGFSGKAFHDHKQYSIGYGTRTTNASEISGKTTIDEAEATARLVDWVRGDREYIRKSGEEEGLRWSDGELDALTSFTYNLGRGNLKKLISNRDKDQIASSIPKYNKVSGKTLPGLVRRRMEETNMFLSDRDDSDSTSEHESVDAGSILAKSNTMLDRPYVPVPKAPTLPEPSVKTRSTIRKPGGWLARTSPVVQDNVVQDSNSIASTDSNINISLSDMPDSSGVEEVVRSGNEIAASSLDAQIKTNESINALVKILSKNSGVEVETPTLAKKQAVPTTNVAGRMVVPTNPIAINPKAKYV